MEPRQQECPSLVAPAILPNSQSDIQFSNDADCLAGKSSILVRFWPARDQVRIVYPKSRQAGISLAGKTRLVFWSKYYNSGIHGWVGLHPVITLYESAQKFAVLRPAFTAALPRGEQEEPGDWMYRSIPLAFPPGRCGRPRAGFPPR